MNSTTKTLQEEKLQSLAQRYTKEGYRVLIKPNTERLPFDWGNYQPSIIAIKDNSGLVIEVKNSINRISVERLRSVSQEVSKHPGWRFLLVTLEDIEAQSLPGTSEQFPSWEEIINRFDQAHRLVENQEIEPAFLFLWIIVEGALRKRAIDASIPVESFPTIVLLKYMYSLGELSFSQFEIIETCFVIRNRLEHGYKERLDLQVVQEFDNLLRDLLEEWKSENLQKERFDNHDYKLSLLIENYDSQQDKLQIERNEIVIQKKAQIAIDALEHQEKENIIDAIHCLEEFPDCSLIQTHKLESTPYLLASTGKYKIIFTFEPGKITVIDIVNYERIENLFGSVKEVKA
ncbi:hypothetical protein [Nostoc sp. MS1]|uniref:hypothetical protein n=1 Tax=Nostoc sp. MS1 TaxID=2764711 RepID=UPI001CC3A425|nr:hypothetical protein [Nostoc sp. MS1]BCL39105.1 hypothetical protein NSMS1_55520 [Nostoc sp. MS1]